MRVGIGYDIHRLAEGRKLVLGGVEIPYVKGLVGHSDADAVLHAVSDALLGAAGLGDIGVHFPDTDPRYRGVSSASLLREVNRLIRKRKYRPGNVDIVVIAQEPRIRPFVSGMVEKIASILDIDKSDVSVKATTNEGVGSLGTGGAIAAYAVAVLEKE